jgi:signal peptidase I
VNRRHDGDPEPMYCMGPSMYPTVKAGDLLILELPDGFTPVRGDVIVFRVPERTECITHRVIEVSSAALRTRGDNNISTDPWMVQPSWVIGKVTGVKRQAKRIAVRGGACGYAHFRLLRLGKFFSRPLIHALSPGYHALARGRYVARIIPLQKRMRIISLKRPQGTELRLILGRLVVGRLPAGEEQWLIRRPFRLWVDESTLPKFGPFDT